MSEIELSLAEAAEKGNVKVLTSILELMAPHEIAEELNRLDSIESNWTLLINSRFFQV
jgi:hypothetical protein